MNKKSVTEGLEELINTLSKRYPEVSFAKLSRIVVTVSKWQKQQILKDAVDGEVVFDYAVGCEMGYVTANINLSEQHLHDEEKVKLYIIKEEQ